jgi:uncharacterized membrane protein YhhN
MNTNKYLGFTIFFAIIFILNLLFFDVLTQYRMVAKPMIMASLIGFYISYVSRQDNTFILALIFALFGDVFLLFDGQSMFMIGLGSFLLMQFCYTIVFFKNRGDNKFLYPFAVVIILAAMLLYAMSPYLGELKIPVMIYVAAIITMTYAAIHRKIGIKGYWLIVIGALLFVVSDGVLAWDKFVEKITGAQYLIMATYMAAQYCIIRGIVEKEKD